MLNSSPALLPPPAKKSQNSGLLTFGLASTYSRQPGTPHLWKRTGLEAVVAQREHLVALNFSVPISSIVKWKL